MENPTMITPHKYTVGGNILTVRNVSKQFGEKLVLRDINFTIKNLMRKDDGIEQGQLVSIIGRSGGGKTTLTKIIGGLLKPTTGEVLIGDENPRPIKKGEVGFVFQNHLVFEHLTIYQNLLLAAYQGMYREHAEDGALAGWYKRQYSWLFNKKVFRDKVDPYLEPFRLLEHVDKYPCELSGGQHQRLAILCQVLCSSELIILDEPFTGQDPVMKQKACEMLIKVAQMGEYKTLIVITHDIDSALWIADTCLILGVQKNAAGEPIPGTTLFEPVDMAARGLAWQDAAILRTKEFNELAQQIKYDWLPSM